MRLDRRHFIGGVAAGAALAALPPLPRAAARSYELVAAPARFPLHPRGTAALGFNGTFPGPVLRARQGEPVEITLINRLDEPTTVHWHGIRLPNAMDGVPYLTQDHVPPGGKFVYRFTPPDAGTFWYHPHADSLEQLGRGLMGALIVEEREAPRFDADILLVLKDWVLDDQGRIGSLTSVRAAGRAGTFGNHRTVNGRPTWREVLPAGARARVRIAVTDVTRVFQIRLDGTSGMAHVLATDGNAVANPWPLGTHALGPGMRVDIDLLMPRRAGEELKLVDVSAAEPWTVATFVAAPPAPSVRPEMRPLPQADIPPPARNAMSLPLSFSAGHGEGAVVCSPGKTVPLLWAVNNRVSDGLNTEPLARLRAGQSYVAELANLTPHPHPIHLHGHTFDVLQSNLADAPPRHFADTVLLRPDERVRAAFVAAPGRWLLHCHIIEHQASGMAGFLEVA